MTRIIIALESLSAAFVAIAILACGSAGASWAALPAPDAARMPAHTGNQSFDGTCQLSGNVRFRPPMTNSPRDGRVRVRLRGQCSGKLTGPHGRSRSINNRAVRARARSHGLESCEAGRGSGIGYLAFGHRRLRFTYKEVRTASNLILKAKGAGGGSATAQGNVSPNADPAAIARACGGDGLRRAPVDVRLATTPSMSG